MEEWRVQEALSKHAYTLGQCVLAIARIEGMKAENINAEQRGDSLPYGEKQFDAAMTEFEIDHNSVVSAFTF